MITASIKTRANEVIVIIRRYDKHPYWTSQNELWYSSWTEIETGREWHIMMFVCYN